MTGPHPAVAAVRLAVRRCLEEVEPGGLVLVACSGGADSLALAYAAAFEAPRATLRAGAVVVDHGLQEGSGTRSHRLGERLGSEGLDPVRVLAVDVGPAAGPGGGPENAARTARYAALAATAAEEGADLVLLGHTRDDQAETVLLRLARGSGARSLAGMPAATGAFRRPLLGLARDTTREACAALGLEPWDDPHNVDDSYARSRVRHEALPALERALGPGVTAALARSADLLREDADALDEWAATAGATATADDGSLDVASLLTLPAAVRRRVLRRAAVEAGCPAGDLGAVHVDAVDALVTRWHGQRPVDLPGRVSAARACDRLTFATGPTRA